jgi:hypothetical protein
MADELCIEEIKRPLDGPLTPQRAAVERPVDLRFFAG